MRTSFAPRSGVEYQEQDGRMVQVYPPTEPPTSTTVTADTDPDDGPEWSVRVAIGRNIGTEPMGDVSWFAFQRAISAALLAYANNGARVETHHGIGTYDGITEESAILSLIGATRFDDAEFLIRARQIARLYDQKAIAVTFGWTSLVTTD